MSRSQDQQENARPRGSDPGFLADLEGQNSLVTFRRWFAAAVQAESPWRRVAREDVEFYSGEQWDSQDKARLREHKRPAVTINKVRPLVNLLSGYQRLNRYEPDFLPRTAGDLEKCKVAGAVTKYLFDTLDYDAIESRVALDSFLTGRGWFGVSWKWDWETLEGDIAIRRVSPFDIYLDPECREADLSDANYLCHAGWTTADKVALQFPEFKDYITGEIGNLDPEESMWAGAEPLWWDDERKKVRLVNIWYRKFDMATYLILPDGMTIPKDGSSKIARQVALDERQICRSRIFLATILGNLVLEDVPSPYEHGMFPYVMNPAYWIGENDIPAGVVRDLKDPQREMNKRRSQLLDFINKMVVRGWIVNDGSMSDEQIRHLEQHGGDPGVVVRYHGAEKPQAFDMATLPRDFFSFDRLSDDDLHQISGINEAMMGLGPASQSGRAKELDQRQAVVSITTLFDNMRAAKKRLLRLLWGKGGKAGLIPQFYKEPRVFRITQDNGQPGFVEVNQRQERSDPFTGMAVSQVLNDLSTMQFDIVISDTPATPSQRVSAFYALLEMAKIGVPVPPDMILEASDIPQKEALKQRLLEQNQPRPPGGGGAPPGAAPQVAPGTPGGPPLPQQMPQQGPTPNQIREIISRMRG